VSPWVYYMWKNRPPLLRPIAISAMKIIEPMDRERVEMRQRRKLIFHFPRNFANTPFGISSRRKGA